MTTPVRVRFAPSPTGYLHVGGARTALFNFLFARHHNGTFLLRIEDTDRTRFQADALEEIYTSLKWLGLDWDEGPSKEGTCGPYVQSERIELYHTCIAQLLKSGAAYRCFCTSERIDALRTEQEKNKQSLGYDKACRVIGAEESDARVAKGEPYVIRLKIPANRKIAFTDMIRGVIEYQSDLLDDLVLLKTDGFPTYHLANVVDDHDMKISHVLRGEEWITSTPRHILLYEAFGWEPPQFAHMPVILSPDGGKLSKRKGAASVMDYKNAGYLPDALFNFLALLGWSPGDDREKMTIAEMIELFSLEKISAKGAILDEKKLDWVNGVYLAERSVEALAPQVVTAWKQKGWIGDSVADSDPYACAVIALLKGRSKRLTELVDSAFYFFKDPESYEEKAAKKYFTTGAIAILENINALLQPIDSFDHATLEAVYQKHADASGLSGGAMIHPTRLAISGVSFGAGLFDMMELIGKQKVTNRISSAIAHIKKVCV